MIGGGAVIVIVVEKDECILFLLPSSESFFVSATCLCVPLPSCVGGPSRLWTDVMCSMAGGISRQGPF